MSKELSFEEIERYQAGEIAIIWCPAKFIITDFKGVSIASLRLIPGDEVLILESFEEVSHGKYSVSINYRVQFRQAHGYISSACIKHKEDIKNNGEYMHVKKGVIV